jgi:hypothetical protein
MRAPADSCTCRRRAESYGRPEQQRISAAAAHSRRGGRARVCALARGTVASRRRRRRRASGSAAVRGVPVRRRCPARMGVGACLHAGVRREMACSYRRRRRGRPPVSDCPAHSPQRQPVVVVVREQQAKRDDGIIRWALCRSVSAEQPLACVRPEKPMLAIDSLPDNDDDAAEAAAAAYALYAHAGVAPCAPVYETVYALVRTRAQQPSGGAHTTPPGTPDWGSALERQGLGGSMHGSGPAGSERRRGQRARAMASPSTSETSDDDPRLPHSLLPGSGEVRTPTAYWSTHRTYPTRCDSLLLAEWRWTNLGSLDCLQVDGFAAALRACQAVTASSRQLLPVSSRHCTGTDSAAEAEAEAHRDAHLSASGVRRSVSFAHALEPPSRDSPGGEECGL